MSLGTWPARKMAAGGMAEVFLAQQRGLAGFERLVVVKRIRRELNQDPRFVDLFLAEARLAAQLRHPNVVEIHDILRQDDDYFIVMDYLAGEDLRTITQAAQPLPVEVASRIVADVAAGLAYAHDARDLEGNPLNVVHRDVSPSNIIVTYAGVAELIDFGIAEANSHHVYTRPDRLRGKLAYSSPEQVSHEPVDAQSDVFSLGVVFHELLTGKRLFRADSPASVVRAVMEQEIAEPSSFNPSVPPAVDAVVMRALTRDRADRTPSASAFLEELEQALRASERSVGNDQVAGWMMAHLPQQFERRRKFEASITKEPPGALLAVSETSTSALLPIHDSLSHSHRSAQAAGDKRIWWGVGAMVVVALFALAFWLGVRRPDAPGPTSGFLVHATPAEASLLVDGEVVASEVGPGVTLPARPGERMQIALRLEGFEEHREELIASESQRELFFNLTRSAGPTTETTEVASARPTPMTTRTPSSTSPTSPTSPMSPMSPMAPTSRIARGTSSPAARGTGTRRERPVQTPPEPEEATLSVRSTPSGAQVVINGQRRGATPLRRLRLEPGREHSIELTRNGYQSWSTRVMPVPGTNPDIIAMLEAVPPEVAPDPPPAPTPTPTPTPMTDEPARRDITVPRSVVGSASRGASLVAQRCSSCHPGGVRGDSRSASAWSRYFSSGRHGRHAMLSDSFSRADLADVKAYLIENAAGVERQSVGGVR